MLLLCVIARIKVLVKISQVQIFECKWFYSCKFSCMTRIAAVLMPHVCCCFCSTVRVHVWVSSDCWDVGKSEAQSASRSGPPRPLQSLLNPHQLLCRWVEFGRCYLEAFSWSTHSGHMKMTANWNCDDGDWAAKSAFVYLFQMNTIGSWLLCNCY